MGASPFASENDLITNGKAKSWRGADVQVECACFEGSALVDDVANLATLIITIVSNGNPGGSPLLQKEIAAAGFTKADLTAQQWADGSEANCHVLFEISKDEMQLDFESATSSERELRIVFHGVTNDATPRYITFGYAAWTVVEDGAQNGLDVVGTSSRTWKIGANGHLQLKHPDNGTWHNVEPDYEDGILGFTIDQDPVS